MPSLRNNILSLYWVQLLTYALPLLTLPWLTRVLGLDGFGRLVFCTAINAYFIMLTDYGFNFTATRAVALAGNDRPARSGVFWTTMTAKLVLACVGLAVLGVLTLVLEPLADNAALLLTGYLAVIGSAFTPLWYFQGTERLRVFSTITIAVRAVSVAALFLLVRTPDDLLTAMAITAGVPVAIGAICLLLLMQERAVPYAPVSLAGLRETLHDGWQLFASTTAISLYTTANTVVLGFLAGPAVVGQYGAAERLIGAAQGLVTPLTQSIFPRVSRLMNESQGEAFALLRKLLHLQGLATLALSALIFVSAPYVVTLIYGPDFSGAVAVLRWLSLLPFLVGLSNVFGINTMLPLGMQRMFSGILITAGALHIVALFVLIPAFSAAGAAMAVLLTECAVTLVMGAVLWRKRIPIFSAPMAA
jgi:PST family polysaccharide transporter